MAGLRAASAILRTAITGNVIVEPFSVQPHFDGRIGAFDDTVRLNERDVGVNPGRRAAPS
jgi:hypothetical protein